MSATLTFRLSEEQRKKLRKKAATLGKSESEFIRELLDRELDEQPLGERTAHLAGSLPLPAGENNPRRVHIRNQNWRE
jgi:Arc/MetJ-type ribon-helix-helix transcriptional regulator